MYQPTPELYTTHVTLSLHDPLPILEHTFTQQAMVEKMRTIYRRAAGL
jgi:hypothetical protein